MFRCFKKIEKYIIAIFDLFSKSNYNCNRQSKNKRILEKGWFQCPTG